MKNLLIGISITLNLLLLLALLFFTNKMGYLGRFLVLTNANALDLPTDTLSSQSWWLDEVKYQSIVAQRSKYDVCLFGDSISSGLGNTLGDRTFNFALPGVSTISLLQQLKTLTGVEVRCNRVVIAIGTNDADYRVTNTQLSKNIQEIVALVREKLGANRVILIPAFYSTVAASHDLQMAGPIDKVEEINTLIRQAAVANKVLVSSEGMQQLYSGKALREDLTTDGVHLNADGRKIYREALLKILKSS